MSQRTYNQLWADCHLELSRLLEEELPVEPLRPEKDRVVFFQRVAMLYVRYIQIFRKLNEIYDQVVHPQKRRFIHVILEGVMGRVLELKNEMVEKESSEYHYMDDILHDLKLTPGDLEIPIPRYFTSENDEEVQDRKMMAIDMLNRLDDTKSTDADLEIPKPCNITSDNNEEDQERQMMFRHVQNPEEMTQDEAIRIIQIVERARKGRLRAHLQIMSKKRSVVPGAADRESAAIRIQKVWRGYTGRKQAEIMRLEEMIFLGMVMDPNDEVPCPAEVAVQANEASTRIKQEEHEKDYQKSIVAVTNKMLEVEGPDMSAMMKDQIRQWFIECRDATGSFPDYPNEEDGGSALIFVEKDPQQLLEDMATKNEEDPSKKAKGKEEETGQGKKNKSNDDEEEEEDGLKMLPSAFLSDLEVGHKKYVDFWKNRDESTNFVQRHEVELIKEEKRKDIEAEIRAQVDVEMRKELDEWRLEVDNEKGGKAKGNAKKKKGSKSAKKKKKEKDLTSERTFESLCEELVEEGLLKMVKDIRLLEYLGDYSYLGTTLRQNDIEPMPSLSDVRQVLSLYGILPLGSQALHEKAPLIKAILLAGPAGVGKKMLVHAICRETGSNLFDLSPVNTAGKYPGKGGLAMMLHVVFKVARLLQPSIIWIEDTEKIFYKKVPKEEKELDPKRLKKDLLKCLKLIKAEDRVLIVGTTKDPMSADIKSFCKMYSKIILIPRPDYGARVLLWKELIKKKGGEITCKLDISSLAKISDGYTPGHMVQVIQNVLTEQRVSQQEKSPLTAAEFVPPLVKIHPVLQDEEEALKNWYSKTPLGKKRIMLATGNEGEGVPAKGKDAKKKK